MPVGTMQTHDEEVAALLVGLRKIALQRAEGRALLERILCGIDLGDCKLPLVVKAEVKRFLGRKNY